MPSEFRLRLNLRFGENPSGRNSRTVWEIATAPYAHAHFATFPPRTPQALHQGRHLRKGMLP